jgi:hypothetical protein
MRRFLILAAAVLAVLVAAHALLWRWGTQQLASGFAGWAAAARAQGWTVTSGEPRPGGWPLAIELSVPGLSLSGDLPDMPVPLTWEAERVVLHVGLLHVRQLLLLPEGGQRLHLGEGADIPFTADRLQIAVPLAPGAPPRSADLAAANLRIGGPRDGAAAALTVALLAGHAAWQPAAAPGESALRFALSAEDIGVPSPMPGGAAALGPRIASLSLQGTLNGKLPPVADLAARAAAWRDGGGSLELTQVALGWGPLGVTGGATLALDERLQPMGTGTLHLRGQSAALDAMVAGHVITPGAAVAVGAVLGLLARPSPDGGAPEVDVPLTLRERTLAVGPIPLTRVPELVWPEPTQPAKISP